jgi:hypothetical protein
MDTYWNVWPLDAGNHYRTNCSHDKKKTNQFLSLNKVHAAAGRSSDVTSCAKHFTTVTVRTYNFIFNLFR